MISYSYRKLKAPIGVRRSAYAPIGEAKIGRNTYRQNPLPHPIIKIQSERNLSLLKKTSRQSSLHFQVIPLKSQ